MELQIIGIDIGGGGMEHTAVSVATIIPTPHPVYDEFADYTRYGPPYQYEIRHLERLPLGTTILKVSQHADKLVRTISGCGPVMVDITAAGMSGFEPFISLGIRCTAVTMSSGDNIRNNNGVVRVPKRELIGNLKAALESGSVRISRALPEADTLIRELMNFKLNPGTRADTYDSWREGAADDLVFAVALSCFGGRWLCENSGPVLTRQYYHEDYLISPV